VTATDYFLEQAARDVSTERAEMARQAARVEVSQFWPFLSAAQDEADFNNRVALVEAEMTEAMRPVTPDPRVHASVIAGLREDWKTLTAAAQRKEALNVGDTVLIDTRAGQGKWIKVVWNGHFSFTAIMPDGQEIPFTTERAPVTKDDAKIMAREWVRANAPHMIDGYPVTASRKEAARELVCGSCGHTWKSRARYRIKCPNCGAEENIRQAAQKTTPTPTRGRATASVTPLGSAPGGPEPVRGRGRKHAQTAWIEVARQVAQSHQHAEVDGMILDATTANGLVKLFDSLSPENQARFAAMPLEQAVDTMWKVVNRTSSRRVTAKYYIREEGGKYWVYDEDGNKRHKEGYDSKEEARSYQKALYANSKDASLHAAGYRDWTMNSTSWGYYLSRDLGNGFALVVRGTVPYDGSPTGTYRWYVCPLRPIPPGLGGRPSADIARPVRQSPQSYSTEDEAMEAAERWEDEYRKTANFKDASRRQGSWQSEYGSVSDSPTYSDACMPPNGSGDCDGSVPDDEAHAGWDCDCTCHTAANLPQTSAGMRQWHLDYAWNPDSEEYAFDGAYDMEWWEDEYRNKFASTASRRTAATETEPCWDCGGTGAVPAGGWEDPADVDNGYVRCPTCKGTGTIAKEASVNADLWGTRTAMPNPVDLGVKVGDIFYSSWGYDQTNIDFYEVVGLTGASVKIRPIDKQTVGNPYAPQVQVVPIPGAYIGDVVMTKRIKDGYQGRPAISISSYQGAWLWDGTPKYQTGSGWGH
jgi:predicted RNA-binding Zn-ribbon protein involved in translation (DUF1610 family)